MPRNYKISQLPELKTLSGNEEMVAVSEGLNVRVKTVRISEFLTVTQAISKTSLGLENVDNTSDADKPITVEAQMALDGLPDITHTHPVSDIIGLQTVIEGKVSIVELATKADTIHSHPMTDVVDLQTELDTKEAASVLASKANVVHNHAIADVTNLQGLLDGKALESDFLTKAELVHFHNIDEVTGLQTALDSKSTVADLATKADLSHTHDVIAISGLQSALDSKSNDGHTHLLADVPDADAALLSIQDRLNVIDGRPHAEGLLSINLGSSITYNITNFDSFEVYVLSSDNGTITRIEDVLTYTPAVAGPGGFTINGKVFTVTVLPNELATPSITNPVNNAVDLGASVTVEASAFAAIPAGSESHISTDWELATDSNFTQMVQQSLADTVNKTNWPLVGLAAGTTFYVRVRYHSSTLTSEWSSIISFSTAAALGLMEEAILSTSDKAANDNIGMSVAIDVDGTRVVIGAPYSSTAGALYSGKVYVFVRSGTTWTEEAILMASDRTADSILGMSVAMNDIGDRLIAGAPDSTAGGVFAAGKAYIFTRSGTTWTEEAILMASDKSASAGFGYSVAMDGLAGRVAIGAQNADPGAISSSGSVYVFTRSGSIWLEETMLAGSDREANDHFGYAVALSGVADRLIVGTPHADPSALGSAGKVYIFSRSGIVWSEEAIIVASNAAANAVFGSSVDMDALGDRVVIGAWGASPGGLTGAGSAYVYLRTGTTWAEETILNASDGAASSRFGFSVSITNAGDKITVGATHAAVSATVNAGQSYVYTRAGAVWTELAVLSASDAETSAHFGYSTAVSADGTRIASGSDLGDVGGVVDSGKVYIFS